MQNITLGILAGMGPRSTTPFLELVLDQCQVQYGAKYDIDYPHMVIYSLPTPFYIDRETDEAALKTSIKVGLERLQTMGANVIAMPCNSAHAYFNDITRELKVPVLNIVEETLKGLEKGAKVTLFATEMTRKSELYQTGMKQHGCEFIFEEPWQSAVNQIILRIKNKEDMATTLKMWNALMESVLLKNIDAVIIACTDLNVVLDRKNAGVRYLDSAEVLAKALIQRYLELQR